MRRATSRSPRSLRFRNRRLSGGGMRASPISKASRTERCPRASQHPSIHCSTTKRCAFPSCPETQAANRRRARHEPARRACELLCTLSLRCAQRVLPHGPSHILLARAPMSVLILQGPWRDQHFRSSRRTDVCRSRARACAALSVWHPLGGLSYLPGLRGVHGGGHDARYWALGRLERPYSAADSFGSAACAGYVLRG